MKITVTTENAIPNLEVRVRDYFPDEGVRVTLNGAPCDHRRQSWPYETVIVAVEDAEDIALSVAWE